jgi:hypothetical protein
MPFPLTILLAPAVEIAGKAALQTPQGKALVARVSRTMSPLLDRLRGRKPLADAFAGFDLGGARGSIKPSTAFRVLRQGRDEQDVARAGDSEYWIWWIKKDGTLHARPAYREGNPQWAHYEVGTLDAMIRRAHELERMNPTSRIAVVAAGTREIVYQTSM